MTQTKLIKPELYWFGIPFMTLNLGTQDPNQPYVFFILLNYSWDIDSTHRFEKPKVLRHFLLLFKSSHLPLAIMPLAIALSITIVWNRNPRRPPFSCLLSSLFLLLSMPHDDKCIYLLVQWSKGIKSRTFSKQYSPLKNSKGNLCCHKYQVTMLSQNHFSLNVKFNKWWCYTSLS